MVVRASSGRCGGAGEAADMTGMPMLVLVGAPMPQEAHIHIRKCGAGAWASAAGVC